MKFETQYGRGELTTIPHASTLRVGMPDVNVEPGVKNVGQNPSESPSVATTLSNYNSSDPELRQILDSLWDSVNVPESVVQKAREELKKEKARGKAKEEAKAAKTDSAQEPIIINVDNDPGWVSKVEEKLLGRKLSEDEQKAILEAHKVGEGEEGKDRTPARAGNYTEPQLLRKMRILKAAGFFQNERELLVKAWVVGMAGPPPDPGTPEFYALEMQGIINYLVALPPIPNVDLEKFRQAIIQNFRTIPFAVPPTRDTIDRLTHIRSWLDPLTKDLFVFRNANPGLIPQSVDIQEAIARMSEAHQGMIGRGPQAFFDRIKAIRDAGGDEVEFLREYVSEIIPSGDKIPDEIVQHIIQADSEGLALKRLVIKILGNSLAVETGDFSIGFYGGINMETIKNLLQSLSENPKLEREQRVRDFRNKQLQDVGRLEQAFRHAHELNRLIVTNNLDGAAQYGGAMQPEFMYFLQRFRGVANVMRILEVAHPEILAREGLIDVKNYSVLMGRRLDEKTGEIQEVQSKDSAFERFRIQLSMVKKLHDSGRMVNNELLDLANLPEWEQRLAFNIGRNLYHIEHRSAEWISQGHYRSGLRTWESPPMEGFARIMNYGEWLIARFLLGKDIGGMEYFEFVMEAMQRARGREGYEQPDATGRRNVMGLKKVRGLDMKIFELPNMVASRSFISSWKASGMILSHIDIEYQGRGEVADWDVYYNGKRVEKETVVRDLVDTVEQAITFRQGNTVIAWKDAPDTMKADYFRSIFLTEGEELRDDLQLGLGTLLRVALGPSKGKDNQKFDRVKEEIRAKIWARVARENPLAIVPLLHGTEYDNGTVIDIYNLAQNRGVDWSAFSQKLSFLNEVKLTKIRGTREPDPDNPGKYRVVGAQRNYSLADAIRDTHGIDRSMDLTPAEIELLGHIQTEGERVSTHFANVRFAFIPFLGDVAFETVDPDDPGAEAMKRHYGDLGGFNSSSIAMGDVVANPLLLFVKDENQTIEGYRKIYKGVTDVYGGELGKAKLYPFIEAGFAFFKRGENGKRWWSRALRQQDTISWILQHGRFGKWARNSWAQYYGNFHIPTMTYTHIFKYLEVFGAEGLMGDEEDEEIKKKFGMGKIWMFFLKMIWEEVFRGIKLGVVIGAGELLRKSLKDDPNLKS